LREILGQKPYASLFVTAHTEAIDALERNFLLLALNQIERGIGEVERAVGADDDVVGAVEFLSLEAVYEYGVLSIRR